MKKIVYLIAQPFDERNYDRFGIQTWIDRGWDVEVWDLTPCIYPSVWQNYIESGHKLKEFNGYFPITTKNQLKYRYSLLEKLEYFIDLTGDYYSSVRIKRRLVKMGAMRVVCATGSIPKADDNQKSRLVSKLRKTFAKGPIKMFKWLINVFVCKLTAPFIKPGLFVVAGKKSIPPGENKQEFIKAHNLDYDIYLKIVKKVGNPAREYAIFIDQDYCFHPDFVYEKIPFFVTPDKYYPAICNGLKNISEILKLDVRIAAHPRTSYTHRGIDYFKGFQTEYGKTADLIRECKAVACHDSTAIQFAVLFKKPIIFLTTNELESSLDPAFGGKSIAAFASELGKSPINIDHNLDNVNWHKELSIDHKKYAEYRNKYIKINGSPEKPHWDIVIDHIEKCVDWTRNT